MKTTSIRPPHGVGAEDLRELWRHRDLLFFLAWRDVKIRYKQALLGMAWAVIQPLGMVLVFTVFFGGLAKIPSGDAPYYLFSMCAVIPWVLFQQGVSNACSSLVANRPLVTKVYFPRIYLPASLVLSPLVDFTPSMAILIGFIAGGGLLPPPAHWAVAFLCLVLCLAASLSIGLWTSAAYAFFRDIRFLVAFGLSLLVFVSPVVYPTAMVPREWQLVYQLNPMVGVIDGFRWALLGLGSAPWMSIAESAAVSALLLLSGLVVFYRLDGTLAEKI